MFPNGRMKKTWFGSPLFSAKGVGVWLLALLLTVCGALAPVVNSVSAQEDVKAVHNLALASSEPGELEVTWDVPTEPPVDYRVSWARDDENFKTWTDLTGNAFPTTNSYTVTGLDGGVRYKVQVRARYQGDRRRSARRLERGGAGGRYGCTDGDPYAYADVYGDPDPDPDCYSDAYPHADGDAGTDLHGDAYRDAGTDLHGHSYSYIDADGHSDADRHSDSDADAW